MIPSGKLLLNLVSEGKYLHLNLDLFKGALVWPQRSMRPTLCPRTSLKIDIHFKTLFSDPMISIEAKTSRFNRVHRFAHVTSGCDTSWFWAINLDQVFHLIDTIFSQCHEKFVKRKSKILFSDPIITIEAKTSRFNKVQRFTHVTSGCDTSWFWKDILETGRYVQNGSNRFH